MKIRNGFVSNSSSSSFLLVIDTAYKKDTEFKKMFKVITSLLYMDKLGKEEIEERELEVDKDTEVWAFSIEYGNEENINTDCLADLKYVKDTISED